MSQPFIYLACFFGGALAFCCLVQWFVHKRRKEALGKEFVLCIHCEKLIEKSAVDHWQECEKHPARVVMEDIRTELGCSPGPPYAWLPGYVRAMKADLRDMALFAYVGEEISIGRLGEVLHMHVFDVWDLVAGMQEAHECFGLESERVENKRLREEFSHFISCVLSVRLENQHEWMVGIADDINRACVALGDPDRFDYVRERIFKVSVDMASGPDVSVTQEVLKP